MDCDCGSEYPCPRHPRKQEERERMTFATPEQIAALAAPTPAEEIGSRPAKGKSGGLSYVDSRFVFDRFDSAVGPENWQCEIMWSGNIELEPRLTREGKEIDGTEAHGQYPMARLGVLTESGWVWKQDIGDFSDIASVKGGVSDSIKRAAVQWGVARDLYPKPDGSARSEVATEAAKPKRKRTTEKAAAPKPAPADDDDISTGLTAGQKRKLFAALGDAGVPRDEYKSIVKTITGKDSTTQMTNDDLDSVLTFTKDGQYEGSAEG